MQSVSHRMGVLTVVERLRDQHGQVRARKLAVLEQQKARRARCRKRFHFWGAVAGQIESGLTDAHWLLRGSGRQSPRDDATRPARGKTKVEWSWRQMANSAEATIPAQHVAFTQQAA